MSRIGKKTISIPKGVTLTLDGQTVTVKGPKGERSWTVAEEIEVKQDGDELSLTPRSDTQRARAMWGLSRTLVSNMVTGVTEGFERTLELVGVGYRAAMKGSNLSLQLGFSHEVDVKAPEGVTFATPKQTEIKISGNDKQVVGEIAANIRKLRPPEPYKGKGVRYQGETVRRKEGKKK
ncbi:MULTISPECIES: 50S ribosomal protein L6 [Brevundimonas]|uniref:50S ribosomal protein L6 n=1 Tax=Brevundimonas TaxID=41275 RepID=UPI000F038892|nr:50S ribosomal protein L6 [Brevundimonas lutea]